MAFGYWQLAVGGEGIMDKTRLCEMLGVACDGTIRIDGLRVEGWGGQIVLDCSYRHPQADAIPFQIVLLDCREIQWRVYAHASRAETLPAALVNIKLGTDGHRKPLSLLTDAFGLTVLYGEMKIKHDF